MERNEIKKENINVQNNEVEQEEIFEKSAKFSEIGAAFVEASEAEMTQEEEILKSPEATPAEKKALLETLKHVEERAKKFDAIKIGSKSSDKKSGLKDRVENKTPNAKVVRTIPNNRKSNEEIGDNGKGKEREE